MAGEGGGGEEAGLIFLWFIIITWLLFIAIVAVFVRIIRTKPVINVARCMVIFTH